MWLSQRRIGTITNLPGDYNLFNFEEAYLEDANAPVLSQAFIIESGAIRRVIPRTHRVAPPFFANLLPDEDGLLRRIVARQQQINRTRDFPFLRALGEDLPGAVVARDLDATEGEREHPMALVLQERPLRFSLAGVQLKFSASMVANRFTIPLSGMGGHWIVKIPTNSFPRLPENEYHVMQLATMLGLNVPEIALVDLHQIEGLPPDLPALRADEPPSAYAIRRFDRSPDGQRIHFEDLNQVADQSPGEKYDGKATHWIANVIATVCPSEDLDEFVRRLVFGVCVGNNDMHLKNWAIAYPDGRGARIAPLYDFVCSRLYYPGGALALGIGGARDFSQVDVVALRGFAQAAEISPRRTLVLAGEIVEQLKATWPNFRKTVQDAELIAALERNFSQVPLMNAAPKQWSV